MNKGAQDGDTVRSADGQVFAQRDRALRSIGFENYADYLQSALWDWIKATLSGDQSSHQCWCCQSRTGLVWHHRDYRIEVLVGNFSNSPPVVIRLCNECHRAIHSDKQQWFDMDVVDNRLEELRERFSYNASSVTRDKLTTRRRGDFDEFGGFDGSSF